MVLFMGVSMAKEYIWETAEELAQKLAFRLRRIRKRRSLSREELSSDSGVDIDEIRRFEDTGEISLPHLAKLAMALGCGEELQGLFARVPYQNIEEVIRDSK